MITPDQTQQIMNIIVTGVIIPVIVAIAGFISAWFKAKTETMKKYNNNQELNKYIDLLDDTVFSVVNGLQQELVDDLKAASQDGKLTTEEQAMIRDKAIKKITTIVGEKGLKLLENVYGDVTMLIDSKIHAEVKQIKEGA